MNEGFLKLLAKHGLPTAGFVVFAYILLGDVRADQEQLKSAQEQIRIEQAATRQAMLRSEDLTGRTLMVLEKVLLVQRIQCVNGADTAFARSECLREK